MGLVGHNIIWWENRSFVREKWGGAKIQNIERVQNLFRPKIWIPSYEPKKMAYFRYELTPHLIHSISGIKVCFYFYLCPFPKERFFRSLSVFFCLLKMPLQNFPSLSHQGLACLGSFCRGGFSPNKTYQAIFWFSSILKTYQAWMLSHAWRRGAFISFFWSQLHRLLSSVSPIFPPDQAHTIYSSCTCTA